MRIEPEKKYDGLPCSYVALYQAIDAFNINKEKPSIPKGTGHVSLDEIDKIIKKFFPRSKKYYYSKGHRVILNYFLQTNRDRCIICVPGHFVFANKRDYYSFFDNNLDEIVEVWYLYE